MHFKICFSKWLYQFFLLSEEQDSFQINLYANGSHLEENTTSQGQSYIIHAQMS